MNPEQEDELFNLAPAFSDLLRAYPDKTVAFQHYARFVTANYHAVPAGTACDCCKGFTPATIHRIAWRGDFTSNRSNWKNLLMLPLLLVGHMHLQHDTVRFISHHRLCTSCRRGIRWRGYASDLARIGINSLTAVLGLATLVLMFICGLPLAVDHRWNGTAMLWLVAVTIGFVYAFRLSKRGGALFLPACLDKISKKFFFIESIREV